MNAYEAFKLMSTPQTADQINAQQTGKVEFHSADEIRSKILEQFEGFKPHLTAYHDYAERMAALSIEYHSARLSEFAPPVEEGVLIASLDARETPKSLDAKLAQLSGVSIKRAIFDRTKATYYLFA